MKVLLYVMLFILLSGGIEIVTETLARNLTKLGHSCTVVTEIEGNDTGTFPFSVVRKPSHRHHIKIDAYFRCGM
jgi:hypothetical protein